MDASGSKKLPVETLHVSCRSAKFDEKKNYIGIILYQFEGKTTWTLNGIKCKSGYIYFQDASVLKNVPGSTMHGKAYYHLFQETHPTGEKLVASGFAYRDGKWLENSSTFNENDTPFTDEIKRAGVTEMKVVKKAILEWTMNGCQNCSTYEWNT